MGLTELMSDINLQTENRNICGFMAERLNGRTWSVSDWFARWESAVRLHTTYRKSSDISRTESQNLNVPRLGVQLSAQNIEAKC